MKTDSLDPVFRLKVSELVRGAEIATGLEGITFAIWMDTCNALAYSVMEECLLGTRVIPTAEELIALLSEIEWEV